MIDPKKKTAEEEALERLANWKPTDEHLMEGQRPLDDDTQGLINEDLTRAYEPVSQLSSEGLLGTNYSPQSEGSQSFGSDPSVKEALERRSNNRYGDFMNGLKRDVDFKSTVKKSDRMASASADLGKNEQIKNKNWQQKQLALDMARQLREQREADRSSFLGKLLGLGLTILGGAVAGPVAAGIGKVTGGSLDGEGPPPLLGG